ncbi:MAG TPA: hypothetical protein VF155_09600 [Candidatus Dormibacteraeota bacterium]
MAVYIVVGLVVLAGLILAYRTLGRGTAATLDPVALMRTVLSAAGDDLAGLGELATATPLLPTPPSAIATARTLRRRFGALAQQLQGVDVVALDDSSAGAHALLAVAVDELVWAASLCADENYGSGDGMRAAVGALRTHAARCLQDAAPLLRASAVAEEVERAP